jgi:hypothetical protein
MGSINNIHAALGMAYVQFGVLFQFLGQIV